MGVDGEVEEITWLKRQLGSKPKSSGGETLKEQTTIDMVCFFGQLNQSEV